MFKKARAEGRHEPYEAYAFDAFIELARRAANGRRRADDRAAPPTPQPTPPQPTEPGDRRRTTKPKATPAPYRGIIRIDGTALRRGWVEGDEVCEIVGLGPIPVSVARSCWVTRSSSS